MSPNAWFWHLHPNTCDILVSISAIDTNAYGDDDEMGKGGAVGRSEVGVVRSRPQNPLQAW